MSARTDPSNRHAKSAINRKVLAKVSQKTRSSNDGNLVRNFATKSRGAYERGRFLLRKEDWRNAESRDNTKNHKDCLSDETGVVSADNDDPIRILQKEIHDWRVSKQSTNELECEHRVANSENGFSQESNCDRVSTRTLPDSNAVLELPSSIVTNHLTRRAFHLTIAAIVDCLQWSIAVISFIPGLRSSGIAKWNLPPSRIEIDDEFPVSSFIDPDVLERPFYVGYVYLCFLYENLRPTKPPGYTPDNTDG